MRNLVCTLCLLLSSVPSVSRPLLGEKRDRQSYNYSSQEVPRAERKGVAGTPSGWLTELPPSAFVLFSGCYSYSLSSPWESMVRSRTATPSTRVCSGPVSFRHALRRRAADLGL